MQDMGPIRLEKDEPVFHATWEARVFALDLAVPGEWTGSAERFQIELIAPADYLLMSYYEKWLTSLVELMVKTGLVTRVEIESGKHNTGTRQTTKSGAGDGTHIQTPIPCHCEGFRLPSSDGVLRYVLFRAT
jgi:nitrile hydratase